MDPVSQLRCQKENSMTWTFLWTIQSGLLCVQVPDAANQVQSTSILEKPKKVRSIRERELIVPTVFPRISALPQLSALPRLNAPVECENRNKRPLPSPLLKKLS